MVCRCLLIVYIILFFTSLSKEITYLPQIVVVILLLYFWIVLFLANLLFRCCKIMNPEVCTNLILISVMIFFYYFLWYMNLSYDINGHHSWMSNFFSKALRIIFIILFVIILSISFIISLFIYIQYLWYKKISLDDLIKIVCPFSWVKYISR